MKLSCEIIQDLLPLYEEKLCSEASREAVEEHLKECSIYRTWTEKKAEFIPQISVDQEKENKAIHRSFRRLKKRWFTLLAAMLLIVPLLLLTVKQIRGSGICLTNADEIMIVQGYVKALENGDFEKAAEYMNYEELYHDVNAVLSLTEEDFVMIDIGGEEWAIRESIYDETRYSESSADEIWADMIHDHLAGSLIYDSNGTWSVSYGLDIIRGGEKNMITLDVSVDGGKLTLFAIGQQNVFSEDNAVSEALFLHYPD